MSLATWKAEFYPRPAFTVPADRALAHSLRKWIGLLPRAMKKHGLQRAPEGYAGITDLVTTLYIDSDTCALCWEYLDGERRPTRMQRVTFHRCVGCPIRKASNHCDILGPFGTSVSTGNPRPMIRILRDAYEAEYATRKVAK